MEKQFDLGIFSFTGIPGLRMVVFSILLMIIVLFFRKGIMGTKEFTWKSIFRFSNKKPLEGRGE
jgi:branched-chain amino acid transport system permease protein